MPIFFVSLFNLLVTPLTCVVVFLLCVELGFSRRTAFVTTIVFGFCTAAWVYARDYFQHPLESLLLLTTVYVLHRNREHLTLRHVLLAGTVFALGVLTRINLVFVLPFLLGYLLYLERPTELDTDARSTRVSEGRADRFAVNWRLAWKRITRLMSGRSARRAVLLALALLAPAVALLFMIMNLNHLRFGDPLLFHPHAQAVGFDTPLWLGLYGNLLSAGRSVFLYMPPVLAGLFAMREFYRKHRAEAILFTSIAVTYLVATSTYAFWDGGWAWGPRHFVPTLPFLLIPASHFLERSRGRWLVAALAVAGIAVQLLGLLVNYSYVYWDWIRMNLSPENAYLFVPELSPIPTHFRALLVGRHMDLWILEDGNRFGGSIVAVTLAVLLLILVGSILLIVRSGSIVEWPLRGARGAGAR